MYRLNEENAYFYSSYSHNRINQRVAIDLICSSRCHLLTDMGKRLFELQGDF